MGNEKNIIPVHHPKTEKDFRELNNDLRKRGFVAIDALKPGIVRSVTLGDKDPSVNEASDLATCIGAGAWSNGPLAKVAWSFFDSKSNKPMEISDKEGKELGLGYIPWGGGDNIPSVIPALAKALPYTAAPLRYIADLTSGLGPRLMYRFPDDTLVEFKNAGEILKAKLREVRKEAEDGWVDEINTAVTITQQQTGQERKESDELREAREAYEDWERTWYGYEEEEEDGTKTHVPGAKEFLDDNNLDLHLTKCEQDDVKLDIFFPTVGFQRGRRGRWNPKIIRVGYLPCHSVRYEAMNQYRHINHVYFSDRWRTKGLGGVTVPGADEPGVVMYPTAMPEHTLSDLRYIVKENRRKRIKDRPTWVVCPTFYPSGGPYYPQPDWWSVFTSKAFDFSSTILYDKAKQRENKTSWGRVIYISLDYLEQVFADEGYQGNQEKQAEFINELEQSMEKFLQRRDNHGKMMRQWMWLGQDGKEHHNVEIVDIPDAKSDETTAGKNELELSTSPIFLALQVDPRLVGVPMVSASNGGTALREMHLLKQQQLNVKQRLYLHFLNTVVRFNEWSERAEFHIAQQTLTTLDNSKTGTTETIAGEGA